MLPLLISIITIISAERTSLMASVAAFEEEHHGSLRSSCQCPIICGGGCCSNSSVAAAKCGLCKKRTFAAPNTDLRLQKFTVAAAALLLRLHKPCLHAVLNMRTIFANIVCEYSSRIALANTFVFDIQKPMSENCPEVLS